MFPLQIMDRLLKLKLDIIYKGLAIEQARQQFNEIKQIAPPPVEPEKKPTRRKLRIPAK
jgi:hypothetical protein